MKIRVIHEKTGEIRMVSKVVAESSQLKKQGYRIEDVKTEKSTKTKEKK